MNTNQKIFPLAVLLIDDDDFSQQALSITLGLWGITDIEVASSGRAALGLLERLQHPPDFLICDIFMPDMDGIEFLSELRKRHYPGRIILVSGGNLDILEMAQQLGHYGGLKVLGTLAKPIFEKPLGELLGLTKPPTCGHSPTAASTR